LKKFLSTLVLLIILAIYSFGQKESFEEVSDKLFLNVYAYGKTDSTTFEFLKKNFPYLTKKKPEAGWSMPPIGIDAKQYIKTYNTFKKHPFFEFKLKEGHLDFFAVESSDGFIYETGAGLWLIFENEADANFAFTKLVDIFSNLSQQKVISEDKGQKTGRFLKDVLAKYPKKAELTLTRESINGNVYKIHFRNWYPVN
jgi:hypothetical protein